MDLKAILKNGAKLLAAGQNNEAYTLLKEAIDEGEEDYRLLCFFALAASNEEEVEEAEEMYEKAIKMDPKTITAWQGLNKLYAGGKLKVDQRAIDTVEVLLKESEESKREILMKDKRGYLIQLGRFTSLTKEDLMSERDHIPSILNLLMKEEKEMSEEERNTCSICFSILGDELDAETALLKSRFLHKTSDYESWSMSVYDRRLNGEDDWVKEKRRLTMAIDYMMRGEIRDECREIIGDETKDPLFLFLFAIDDEDLVEASEILESCQSLDGDIPLSLASLRMSMRDEDYEGTIQRIHSLKRTKLSGDKSVLSSLCGLEAECFLRSGQFSAALSLLPLSKPSYAFVEARILQENGQEVKKEVMESLDEMDRIRLEVRRLLKEGKKEEAEKKSDGLDEEEWEDVLLKAECSPPSKGMNLLVKTAKINARCSRAFYLLATILRGKNGAKAESLAERASSIRHGDEEYARLVDELMCENGADEEKRLEKMDRFVNATRRIPEWARITIGRLLLHCNRVNDALTHLQAGITSDHSAIRWALLGEAYSLRGQLSSSINAYEESLKKERKLHIVVSMISVSLRLNDFPRTISLCNEWLDEVRGTLSLSPILLILCQSIIALCEEDLSTYLPTLFTHISELITLATPSSILYKLLGDSLILLAKTSDEMFSRVKIPQEWKLTGRVETIKLASLFYSRCVGMKKEEGSYWADLSLALFSLWKIRGEKNDLERSRKCLIQSINISGGKKKSVRSRLWTKLAEIEEERGEKGERVRHCLSRSLQLDGRNDEAWLRLAVLLFNHGEMNGASECIEKATKWNPLQCEGWSVWAEMAWRNERREDGEDMMRHAITLNPTVWAVRRYTQMVCERLETGGGWNAGRSLIKMERVIELKNYACLNLKEDQLRLAILAELCGCIEEAREIHEKIGDKKSIHWMRNELKYACLPSSSSTVPDEKNLLPIIKLRKEDNNRLRELVEASEYVLDPSMTEEIIVREEEGEGEEKKEKVVKTEYCALKGQINVPLLVSSIITFNKEISSGFVSQLHDLSPRDELIDYFPTVIPEEVDNGIRFIAKDGEEPYRMRFEVAKKVYEILKKRRFELEASQI